MLLCTAITITLLASAMLDFLVHFVRYACMHLVTPEYQRAPSDVCAVLGWKVDHEHYTNLRPGLNVSSLVLWYYMLCLVNAVMLHTKQHEVADIISLSMQVLDFSKYVHACAGLMPDMVRYYIKIVSTVLTLLHVVSRMPLGFLSVC